MPDKIFDLTIKGRDGLVYQGKVESLTSVNEEGEFDILAQHANFISLIKDKIVYKEVDGEEKEIKISNALLRTRQNKVEIYLGVEGIIKEGFLPKGKSAKTKEGKTVETRGV